MDTVRMKNGTTRDTGHTARMRRLQLCAYAAPLVAQCVMLMMLVIQRHWLFAMMTGSGCVATLASLMLMTAHPHAGNDADAIGAPAAYGGMSTPDEDRAAATIAAAAARIASPDLPTLLGFADDAAPFRSIAHMWCIHDAGCHAPVGLDTAGDAVDIDMGRFGPHAIVAGTTGSGKSVLLQDWCLALACRYPPERIQFVLLDFKGGSAMDVLGALPHVRGCVNDLDLAYAKRSLLALERELTRRERIAAAQHASDLMDIADAPARLVAIVDEFHMLAGQLPDLTGRLARIASLGRSLGMHLIVCTQNPLGEVSAPMKANMALRVCLRVRDPMQSQELLGVSDAAFIGAKAPGAAIAQQDDAHTLLRCAANPDPARLVDEVRRAARVHGARTEPALFTAPLPTRVRPCDVARMADARSHAPTMIPIGLEDDGVATGACMLDTSDGNLAVIGRPGRGRTTLLTLIGTQAEARGLDVVCLDDADAWLDPFNADPEAVRIQDLVCNGHGCVVFALGTTRRLRVPDHCTRRLIFPTGDRAVDLADGIPAPLLDAMDAQDMRNAGRGVLIEAGRIRLVQCACP